MAIKLKTNTGAIDLTNNAVIRGIDGGYYIPNVDLDGNLSWTAVKEGMPTVPGANIRGIQGEPGVYIGTNPGEDDLVWIDPSDGEVTGIITPDEVQTMINNAIIKPDLTGYATINYVDNAVNNIEFPEPDLSAYAKKTEVPKNVSQLNNDMRYVEADALNGYALKTEIPNMVPYANRQEVEGMIGDAVDAIEVPEQGLDSLGNDIATYYVRKILAEQGKLIVYKGNGLEEEVTVPYLTENDVKALITAELGVIENGTY